MKTTFDARPRGGNGHLFPHVNPQLVSRAEKSAFSVRVPEGTSRYVRRYPWHRSCGLAPLSGRIRRDNATRLPRSLYSAQSCADHFRCGRGAT
jgi:hypothetical protein